MNFDGIDWGDFPTWLLVAVTCVAVISAGKILGIERTRDQKRFEAERRAQASLVSAWTVANSDRPDDPRVSVHFVNALALNGSNQPIYRINIDWCQDNKIIRNDLVDLIPPNQEFSLRLGDVEFCKVIDQELTQSVFTSANARRVAEHLRIEITFTDTENQRWIRGRDGLLLHAETA